MGPVCQETGALQQRAAVPELACPCGAHAETVVDCDTSLQRGFVHVLLDCLRCGRFGWVEVADEVLRAFDDAQPAAMSTTPASARATPPS